MSDTQDTYRRVIKVAEGIGPALGSWGPWHAPPAGEGVLIWWRFEAEDVNQPGVWVIQTTRKHWVEPGASDEAILRLYFEALLRGLEHEAREFFQYQGKRVFDPHRSVL